MRRKSAWHKRTPLPDPRFKLELQDVTRMGAQNPTLWPSDVGSTRYTFTQELPWFGTRALKRAQAQYTVQSAQTSAQGVWVDLASRIKLAYAQLYFLSRNQRLSQEILGLMQSLEQIAQVRYASGLAPQQDAIRAQTEQTADAQRVDRHAKRVAPGACAPERLVGTSFAGRTGRAAEPARLATGRVARTARHWSSACAHAIRKLQRTRPAWVRRMPLRR